jgi:hypothetical protein
MKVDNTSLFFNAPLAPGEKGGTAAWGTAVGQSKKDKYKFDRSKSGIDDFIIGINYRINTEVDKLDISAGSTSRELLLFSIFEKVYVNGQLLIDSSFILLLVKEHSDNHDGRIIISYPPYASYQNGGIKNINSDTFKKMALALECPNGCWFVYDISIKNQDELHFHAIVVAKSSVEYKSSQERKMQWDKLVELPASPRIPQIPFNYKIFERHTNNAGLIFSPQLIQRFIASLCTKPFVICSGLSGSGKTKLAQAFAQWITSDESQYVIVPVGADWTNREPLLGYPNALNKEEYVSPENGVLDLMIRAKENIENIEEPTKPHFLILDEMNLSHVERYFADFLSTMESGDKIPLHKIENDSLIVPPSIELPKNLFIVGTVNIDETTYMFSPKVLDRANTIEFRLTEKDLADFIDSDLQLDMELLKAQGANMSDSFMTMALQKTDKNLKPSEAGLKLFFSELKKSGAEFGYRTASEIGRLMYMLNELGESGDNLLDIAIMQKLLPKLHGSRNKLTKVLPILGGFCLTDNSKIKEDYLDKFVSNNLTEVELKADTNIKYKISFEKICRMYKNAVENGFASYAEA